MRAQRGSGCSQIGRRHDLKVDLAEAFVLLDSSWSESCDQPATKAKKGRTGKGTTMTTLRVFPLGSCGSRLGLGVGDPEAGRRQDGQRGSGPGRNFILMPF